MKHVTVVRPTMYMASLDIRTAFDETKPKHVARILYKPQYTQVADCGPFEREVGVIRDGFF